MYWYPVPHYSHQLPQTVRKSVDVFYIGKHAWEAKPSNRKRVEAEEYVVGQT